jgi:biotin operon repressor
MRLETFFVGLCVAIGDIEGKPFSVAKIAAYMRVPRTTVIRRLDRLQSWGLIDRRGRHYYMHEKKLNPLIGMRSYQQVRRFLSKATEELSVLDTLADWPWCGMLRRSACISSTKRSEKRAARRTATASLAQ